jgi:hypothetical protein
VSVVCVQYLTTLYEKWNKPAERASWTARLPATNPSSPTTAPATQPVTASR